MHRRRFSWSIKRTSNRRSAIRVGIKWPQKWLLLFYYSNFYPDELVGTKIQKHSIPGNDLQERLVFEEGRRRCFYHLKNATTSAIKSLPISLTKLHLFLQVCNKRFYLVELFWCFWIFLVRWKRNLKYSTKGLLKNGHTQVQKSPSNK